MLQPLGIAPVSAAAEEWPEHADELTASGATWCVILGNRRLWAAAKAGLETVPVYKISGDLRVAMLSENINRQDMRPLAEADVLLELVNRLGGQQQAASALGRSQGWVSQRLALRRLAPELQAAIEAGELTARDARSYTSLSHDEQRAAYYRVIPTPSRRRRSRRGRSRFGFIPACRRLHRQRGSRRGSSSSR